MAQPIEYAIASDVGVITTYRVETYGSHEKALYAAGRDLERWRDQPMMIEAHLRLVERYRPTSKFGRRWVPHNPARVDQP